MLCLGFLTGSVICSGLTFHHEYKLFLAVETPSFAGAINAANAALPAKPTFVGLANTTISLAPAIILLNFLNSISPYLTLGWVLGMMFYLVRIINSGFYLNRLRKTPGDLYPEVSNKVAELVVKLKISKTIGLIINSSAAEPLTFGHFKPVILIPCSLVTRVPMEQLEMILAHELAHIKRYDYLVNLLQTALEAIYFFNPFFRAISGMARDERECCCDEMAATVCGNKKTMAVALANLKASAIYPNLALHAAPKRSAFYERINRLIDPAAGPRPSLKKAAFTFLLITFTLLFLTKCVSDHNENDKLPTAKDTITQLLTDNQANYKEQLFSYEKAGGRHDIFLVSTVNGRPLYAYVDGAAASKDELARIASVLQQKRNMTPAEIAAMGKQEAARGANRHWKRHTETDSLNKLIRQTKAVLATRRSTDLEKKLIDLNQQVGLRNKEEVDLSMAEYRAQEKQIPADLKLHVLLTKIITNKEYTADERTELIDLARKKQGI